MPTRDSLYVNVKLYNVGHGTPTCHPDHGFGAHDILARSHASGAYDYAGTGLPTLQYIDGVGLVNRAALTLQNTRLAQFTTSGGAWQEFQPSSGVNRVYRLMQYSAAAGVTYSATSLYSVPENAEFAFSLIRPDAPRNATDSWVRFEFGNTWGVLFRRDGTYLVRNVGGTWQGVESLSINNATSDLDEIVVFWRPLEGKLALSFDYGRSYTVYAPPDGSTFTVPAGTWRLSGQDGMVYVGLHQLALVAGTFTNRGWDTLRVRTAPSGIITGRYTGDVAFTDLGNGPSRWAQYRATLTPAPNGVGTVPFAFQSAAVLRSVTYRYTQSLTTYGSSYSTDWNDYLIGWDLDLPYELDGGTLTLTLKRSAWAAFDFEGDDSLRDRWLQFDLGYNLSDSTQEVYTMFSGYVRGVRLTWSDEWGGVVVKVTVDNPSYRFRRSPWTVLDLVPLGGMTPNAAADYLLQTQGLDSSWRSWHAVGALRALDQGTPEEPFELLREGELPWETLRRILGYECLEPEPLADGTFRSVVKDAFSADAPWEVRADYDADPRHLACSIDHGVDYSQSGTAILVTAEGVDGSLLMFGQSDPYAESDLTSGRFSLMRTTISEQVTGRPTAATILGRAQALARMQIPLKWEGSVELPLHLGLTRRQRIQIYGCEGVGIPEGTIYGVLSLAHSGRAEDALWTMRSAVGFRRLGRLSS